MFSTVDSPGARFLRVYIVTPQGDIPVMIPDNLRDQETELRTLATQQLADEFAGALAQGTWVKLRMASAVPYYLLLWKLYGQDRSQDRLTADLDTNSQRGDDVITFDKFNFVRMLKPNEPLDASDTKIDVDRIRVELWKYAFDKGSGSLRAQKHLQATLARSE